MNKTLPVFKNTEDALQYGREHAGNQDIINLLNQEYNNLRAEARRLMDAGEDGKALLIMSGQGQFCREAREEAERC